MANLEWVTTSGFLEYQLVYYIDNRTSIANADDGLLYADDVLENCSVLSTNLITISQYPYSMPWHVEASLIDLLTV